MSDPALTQLQSSHFFRPRPLAQGFAALPGSTRNISLSSSKPAPTTPSNPTVPEETIPSEVAAQPSASDAVNAVSENLSQASSVVPSDASIVSDATVVSAGVRLGLDSRAFRSLSMTHPLLLLLPYIFSTWGRSGRRIQHYYTTYW